MTAYLCDVAWVPMPRLALACAALSFWSALNQPEANPLVSRIGLVTQGKGGRLEVGRSGVQSSAKPRLRRKKGAVK